MAVHGRCLCEGVKFEVDADPLLMGTCHCTRCQRRSGGAGITAVGYPLGSITYTQGEDLISEYEIDADSKRHFCSRCGSAMPGSTDKFHIVQVGLLDEDPGMRPQFHMMVDYKAPGDEIHDDLPQFGEYPPMEV